jgi:hypothetical protein
LLDRRGEPRDWFGVALAGVFLVLVVLAVEQSLGLVFDPRYRDIPFAPQSGAVVAYLVLMLSTAHRTGTRPAAETLAAAVMTASAVYIAINETFANWQALWLAAGLIGLAVILVRARDVPG